MNKNLRISVVLASLLVVIGLGMVVFNKNITSDTNGQLASLVGPTITNVQVSNITMTSATISWKTNTASTSKVEIKKAWTSTWIVPASGTNAALVTEHSLPIDPLVANTKYSYRVTSCDDTNTCKTWTSSSKFTTLKTSTTPPPDTTVPSAPANLAVANITNTTAVLSWTASTDNVGVVGYNLYKDQGNGTFVQSNTSLITSTSYNLSGLTPGMGRTFKVQAVDAAGNKSAFSNPLTFLTTNIVNPLPDTTAPSVPANLALISKTYNSIAFSWGQSSDNVAVTAYEVYKDGSFVTTTSTATSITLINLSASTTYNLTVKAKDAAGNTSAASVIFSVMTASAPDTIAPTAPTALSSSNLTPTSVDIAWTASTDNVGVIEYQVYAQIVNAAGNPITANTLINGTVSATSINLSGLTENTNYVFTISSKDASNNYSPLSAPLPITTPMDIPSTPALSLISKTHNSVALSWTPSTGSGSSVSSYDVFKNGVRVNGTSTATSITLTTGINPATPYSFTVTANNALGHSSSPSNTLNVTTTAAPDTQAPTAPTGLNAPTAEITTNSLNLYWAASTDDVGVVEYQIFQSPLPNGVTNPVTGTVSALSAPIPGLSPSTTYSFTIKAKDAANNVSPASTALSVTTKTPPDTTAPSVPSGVIASNITQTAATLSWTASTDNVGVVSYNIYKNGALVNNVTSTSYNSTGLTPGTTKTYTVSALDADGNQSAQSTGVPVTTLSAGDTTAPTISGVTSTPSTTGVTIAWTTNEATDSQISYGTTSSYGSTSVLDTTLATSHSVTVAGLNSATLYHFKVTSKDAAANSTSSADQTFTTTTAAPVCLNAITNPADGRDVWAWHGNTQLITPNSAYQTNFFTYADSHKVQTIYLNANASFVNNNATNIKDFLNKAKAHCMDVEALGGAENWVALPGNPYFTQGATTTAALDFATAVKNFNNSVTGTNAKFSAIQYDVEPHTIGSTDGYYPYYGLSDANYTPLQANTAIINALIDMTQAVKAITGSSVKVNLAPPRWYDTSSNLTPFSRTGVGVTGKNAMEYLFDNVDILSIQDYVDTASNIHDDAVGELNYAAAHGKKVNVGILLDNSAPASSNFFGSTCANLNSTLQAAYDLMTATEKSAFGVFSIEQYDTGAGYTAGTPSSWTAMCP